MQIYRWSLLSIAALTLAATAAEPPQPSKGAVMISPNGMKAGIDRQTGELRPLTAEESRQLDQKKFDATAYSGWKMAAPPDEAAALAQARTLANGAVAIKVPESNASWVIATRDTSGKLVLSHNGEQASAQGVAAKAKKETVRE
jgi:hypothetical protein